MGVEVRQLFDQESGTYTYLVIDESTKDAIIIDSVKEQVDRERKLLEELGINLKYILDTHIHADHVTGASALKKKTGAKIVLGAANNDVQNVDKFLEDGEELTFGKSTLKVLFTPGHTGGCTTYLIGNYAFTADTLLIRSVGRTDFQGGDPKKLYASIQKLFALPDETVVYPAHNYLGITKTTIGEEKQHNAFITAKVSEEEFVKRMNDRKLPLPKKIEVAVPANKVAGA